MYATNAELRESLAQTESKMTKLDNENIILQAPKNILEHQMKMRESL